MNEEYTTYYLDNFYVMEIGILTFGLLEWRKAVEIYKIF